MAVHWKRSTSPVFVVAGPHPVSNLDDCSLKSSQTYKVELHACIFYQNTCQNCLTAFFELTLILFSLFFLLQRGSIGPCGWSSPYLPQPMLLWQSERSSSWTPALRNKHSSTPRGSTETQTPFSHNMDCCCRLQSTCTLWLLTVVFLSVSLCLNEKD